MNPIQAIFLTSCFFFLMVVGKEQEEEKKMFWLAQQFKCYFGFQNEKTESCTALGFDDNFKSLYISSVNEDHHFIYNNNESKYKYSEDLSNTEIENEIFRGSFSPNGMYFASGRFSDSEKTVNIKLYQVINSQDRNLSLILDYTDPSEIADAKYYTFKIGDNGQLYAAKMTIVAPQTITFTKHTSTVNQSQGSFAFTGSLEEIGYEQDSLEQYFYLTSGTMFYVYSQGSVGVAAQMGTISSTTGKIESFQFINSTSVRVKKPDANLAQYESVGGNFNLVQNLTQNTSGIFTPDLQMFISYEKGNVVVQNATTQTQKSFKQRLPICNQCYFQDFWVNKDPQNIILLVRQDKWISVYKWKVIDPDDSWEISVIVLSCIVGVGALVGGLVYYFKQVKGKKKSESLLQEENSHH